MPVPVDKICGPRLLSLIICPHYTTFPHWSLVPIYWRVRNSIISLPHHPKQDLMLSHLLPYTACPLFSSYSWSDNAPLIHWYWWIDHGRSPVARNSIISIHPRKQDLMLFHLISYTACPLWSAFSSLLDQERERERDSGQLSRSSTWRLGSIWCIISRFLPLNVFGA